MQKHVLWDVNLKGANETNPNKWKMDSKKFTPFGNNGKKGDRPIHHIAH
jgi:hypothetical protein